MEEKKEAKIFEMEEKKEAKIFEMEKKRFEREMKKLETEHKHKMEELPSPLFLRLIGPKTMSAEMVGTIRSALLVVGSITVVVLIVWRRLSGWEVLDGRVKDMHATLMAYVSGNHRDVEELKPVPASTIHIEAKPAK